MVNPFYKNLRLRTFAAVMLLNFFVILLISIFSSSGPFPFLSENLPLRSTNRPRAVGSAWTTAGSQSTRLRYMLRLMPGFRR